MYYQYIYAVLNIISNTVHKLYRIRWSKFWWTKQITIELFTISLISKNDFKWRFVIVYFKPRRPMLNVTLILADLKWRFRLAFLITCCLYVCPSVCHFVCTSVNFSYFWLHRLNTWAKFNQTWYKAFLW